MKTALSELDMSLRLGLFALAHFLTYSWTRYVVAPARVGWQRLMLAAFLAPMFFFVCFVFDNEKEDEFMAFGYGICTFLWLTPFKILALCINRGQIAKAYDSGNNAALAIGLLLPVSVAFEAKRVEKESENEAKKRHVYRDARFSVVRYKDDYLKTALSLVGNIILKYVFMFFMRKGYYHFHESGLAYWGDFCAGWYVYASTSVIAQIVSLLAMLAINTKLEPGFDQPWLSQSVKELWAKRYNLTFAKTLRSLTYEPIYEGCWIAGPRYFDQRKPSTPRKAAAVFSTFVASAVMHMVLVRAACTPGWPYLHGLFFVINGLIIFLEEALKSMTSSSNMVAKIFHALPSLLFQAYTIFTIFTLNHLLFWPESEVCDYTRRVLDGGLSFLPPERPLH